MEQPCPVADPGGHTAMAPSNGRPGSATGCALMVKAVDSLDDNNNDDDGNSISTTFLTL